MRGFPVGDVISALQKAIRRSDEEQAVAWAAELVQSGEATWCWNRLEIICSEDIGIAWPEGPAIIAALRAQYERAAARKSKSYPERLFVVHAAMLLARAPKSRRVDNAVWATFGVQAPMFPEIPDYALDHHTAAGKAKGRGAEFWAEEASKLVGEADLGENPYYERSQTEWSKDAFATQLTRDHPDRSGPSKGKSTRKKGPATAGLFDNAEIGTTTSAERSARARKVAKVVRWLRQIGVDADKAAAASIDQWRTWAAEANVNEPSATSREQIVTALRHAEAA
ncbi:MAG: hypothetical protein AAFZ07_25595 [Actinomycetota bacterium]